MRVCIALLFFLLGSTHAWVVSPLQQGPRRTALFSTIEASSEAPSAAVSSLKPNYAAGLDAVESKLEASMPEALKNKMMPLLKHFASEYLKASQDAYEGGRTEGNDPSTVAQRFLTCVGFGVKYGMPSSPDFYAFDDVSHKALRGKEEKSNGIDFYRFGCAFFEGCMDLKSPDVNVMGQDNLKQAMDQIAAGENVVFFANHQSEADPQVVSACFERVGYDQQASDMEYVAGHKVTTDPLAIPFSMGRNLICIHSKKHIDADPETKPTKQRQNLKAMNALLKSLKDGGALIWVAPSGGRDRRNVETGEVPLADFDSKTIDMFRLMGNKSKKPTHYYTMAMVTYDLCPPPDTVEAEVGEMRQVRFVPVGIAVGKELESVGGLETRKTFCHRAQDQCQADYEKLQEMLMKE